MRNVVLVGTAVTRPEAVGTLYRLRDGGSWESCTGIAPDAAVQAITPHPQDPDLIFVAARNGLYRSHDGGERWQRLPVTDEAVQFWTVVVSPHDPKTLFAGTSPVGFYRSHDGGDSWSKCEGSFPERYKISFGHSRLMRIAFHPTDPDVMYGASEITGFYISTDAGRSWRAQDQGIAELAALPHLKNTELTDDDTEGMFDAHAVATTPARPEAVFYVCRMGLFESVDGGRHFRDLEVRRYAPFNYSRDCRPVYGRPEKLYACFSISSRSSAGAMYTSDDLGETWRRADTPVNARSTIMGFGTHVSDARGVVSVTRHGQVFVTTDGAQSWREYQLPEDAGDAFCAAIL